APGGCDDGTFFSMRFHLVLGARSPYEEKLITVSGVNCCENTDALVIVVVPDRIDLGSGLQQVRGDFFTAFYRELCRYSVVYGQSAALNSISESFRPVLRERQGVNSGDFRYHGIVFAL